MLALDSVSKSYGEQSVLHEITHVFRPGLNLLLGPSGAGKSTLLRLCATAERPSGGTLSWNDKPYSRVKRKLRAELGYAPQLVDLPEDVTGLEFLAYIAALKGVGRGARDQASALLDQLGLAQSADQRVMGWSGGMRRRLILAQALLGSPKLVVLDEPTAELDADTAARVATLICFAARSATVLLATHLTEHFDGQAFETLQVTDGRLSIP